MANDFISREDAIQCANDLSVDLLNARLDSASYGAQAVSEWLKDIPAADVRPVVRGRWIPYRPDCRPVCDWKCSTCGYDPDLGTQPFFDFCPNCGAGMKEVNSGDTRTQG